MAHTMPAEAHPWANAWATSASARKPNPRPPSASGAPAPKSWAARMAATASAGKRALRSTSSAAGAATSAPIRSAACRAAAGAAAPTISASIDRPPVGVVNERTDRLTDAADGGERTAVERTVGELNLELALERDEEPYRTERPQPYFVQVVARREVVRVGAQDIQRPQDLADPRLDLVR